MLTIRIAISTSTDRPPLSDEEKAAGVTYPNVTSTAVSYTAPAGRTEAEIGRDVAKLLKQIKKL